MWKYWNYSGTHWHISFTVMLNSEDFSSMLSKCYEHGNFILSINMYVSLLIFTFSIIIRWSTVCSQDMVWESLLYSAIGFFLSRACIRGNAWKSFADPSISLPWECSEYLYSNGLVELHEQCGFTEQGRQTAVREPKWSCCMLPRYQREGAMKITFKDTIPHLKPTVYLAACCSDICIEHLHKHSQMMHNWLLLPVWRGTVFCDDKACDVSPQKVSCYIGLHVVFLYLPNTNGGLYFQRGKMWIN